ncbi:hypothetical protein ACFGVR_04015 [Mucilaginibacter sp. AW1-3]
MKRTYLLLIFFSITVSLMAQSKPAVNEFVIQQKANVIKAANGSFKKPDKFTNVSILFNIGDQSIGMYPGNKKERGFGIINGGFIHLKELKPRKGFERELAVDDIDEKPHDQVTPVHITIKRQPGKLNYQIVAEFPTHVVFYNAITYDDYQSTAFTH